MIDDVQYVVVFVPEVVPGVPLGVPLGVPWGAPVSVLSQSDDPRQSSSLQSNNPSASLSAPSEHSPGLTPSVAFAQPVMMIATKSEPQQIAVKQVFSDVKVDSRLPRF